MVILQDKVHLVISFPVIIKGKTGADRLVNEVCPDGGLDNSSPFCRVSQYSFKQGASLGAQQGGIMQLKFGTG